MMKDISEVLKSGGHLKKWLVVASHSSGRWDWVSPLPSYSYTRSRGRINSARRAMVTGSALASIALGIPLGRLADRIDRKEKLYITIPLFWIFNLMLLLHPPRFF